MASSWETFGDLKNLVKDGLADHTDTFFSDKEVGDSVNEGIWEIYKILHASNRGFFFNTTPESITLAPSTYFYTLTNEFGWVDEIRAKNAPDRSIRFFYQDRHSDLFREMFDFNNDTLYPINGNYYYDVVDNKSLLIVPAPTQSIEVEVFLVQDPTELEDDITPVPMKKLWRPLVIQYAIRKLKNKEETGEYLSTEKLLQFLLENLSKYAGPRGGTNPSTVDDYSPY